MAENTIRTLEDLRRRRPEIMALARRYRSNGIAVFGSCARGDMQPDSDIDFLVDFEPDFRLTDVIRLMQGLEKMLGRKVDVVPKETLRDELRPYVLKEVQEL